MVKQKRLCQTQSTGCYNKKTKYTSREDNINYLMKSQDKVDANNGSIPKVDRRTDPPWLKAATLERNENSL